ncbi:hypothetical protein BGW38_002675, partial [Lunasporangiospora selenospora]
PSSVVGTASPTSLMHGQHHDQPQQVAVVPLQRSFTFDHVFGTGATQEEVYYGSVRRMVEKFMEGYNVTIMAYGQTSSGKTYTMGTGAPTADIRGSTSEGIIPRAMAQLFHEAKRPPLVYPGYKIPPLKTLFKVSFVEIYNEDLIDLLVKGDFRPPVTIREDTKGNIYWTGVQEVVVTSVEEVIHLLWFGSQNRQTHSTEMNEKSSRSHAIFSITLRQEKFVPTQPMPPPTPHHQPAGSSSPESQTSPTFRRTHLKTPSIGLGQFPNGFGNGAPPSPGLGGSMGGARPATPTTPSSIPSPFTSGIVAPGSKLKRQSTMVDPAAAAAAINNDDPEPEGEWIVLNSKFHFVDLAGSERLKRTSAIGDRAKEGISINAGLHALGNVISALGDPSKRASHIPYRDSKLTRLLQDSLGGNALALMIACVSPSEINLGETLNTLKYANRARNIKNSSSLNQEINMDNPEYLRSIIQKLKHEIRLLKEAAASSHKSESGGSGASESPSRGGASSRMSIAGSTTTMSGLDIHADDSEDGLMSPSSPSRRLKHYQSRDSIATDISHNYLDAVREEEDRYSETSSSARTAVLSNHSGSLTGSSSSSSAGGINGTGSNTAIPSPSAGRPMIPSLTLPSSMDSRSVQDVVGPIIDEYTKVITGLESHLAMAQAALNHSEQMLEEQQGRIDAVEAENQTLVQKQELAQDKLESKQKQVHEELEASLEQVQEQLRQAEERKAESQKRIQELEDQLTKEQASAQEILVKALKEKEEQLAAQVMLNRSEDVLPTEKHNNLEAIKAKEQELQHLTERIEKLEDGCHQFLQIVEADTEALKELQVATASVSGDEREAKEAMESKREEELIEKLQAKASLEMELESERSRREHLVAEIKTLETESLSGAKQGEDIVPQLAVSSPVISDTLIIEKEEQIKDLMVQLAVAKDSEKLLKEETAQLAEKLEDLQKAYKAAMEMEEMLQLAVSDLEGRLKVSQDSQLSTIEELEKNLTRIQDLEERSTKAEKDALEMVEGLKVKLADAKASAEERLADELLELLEKMDKERAKVEELQTKVENLLVELAAEKTRAAEAETERELIQAKWDADKARIHDLEQEIDTQTHRVQERDAQISTMEERATQHEGTLAAKMLLEQQQEQLLAAHNTSVAAKSSQIKELELKIQGLEKELEGKSHFSAEYITKIEAELTSAVALLEESKAKALVQEKTIDSLQSKLDSHETDSEELRRSLADKESQHTETLRALELKMRLIEADRDDAETRLEEAERQHQVVDEELKSLQEDLTVQQSTVELLQSKLAESQARQQSTPESSRPVSQSSSSVAIADDASAALAVQKLEKEKARYRALVRENESEIERLTQELESLANEFTSAATIFEDAEEEMKAKIIELETLLAERSIANKPTNLSSTSLASSLVSTYSARNRESGGLHPSSAPSSKAQIETLTAERDQAFQSSDELSLIVADLNEKNHSLQERLATLEREQESVKLQQLLERQSLQDEIRILKERAERLDRSSPSPLGATIHGQNLSEEEQKILRHKASTSDVYVNSQGEDSLATPRQSWSTTASVQQGGSVSSTQTRAGRHESTIIQQAKHIKILEERLADLQQQKTSGQGRASPAEYDSQGRNSISGHRPSTSISSSTGQGLGFGIQHKPSDSDLVRPPLISRQSTDRSPALRSLATFGPGGVTPTVPPPTTPLPTPPITGGPSTLKSSPHLNGVASPPSPRVTGVLTVDTNSAGSSPHMRPSSTSTNTGSIGRAAGSRRERDSSSSNISDVNGGWASPTGNNNATNASHISAATAQALQGVEVNELRGVVDTLAHQVQALKVEQAMLQGKVQRLEASLAEAEARLKTSNGDRDASLAARDQ